MMSACDQETSSELALPREPVSQLPADADVVMPAKAGGYVPSASERVPGITMSQQELDKIYAEARKNMPVPVIPAEAQ